MFKAIFDAQIRMRNKAIRGVRQVIEKVDRQVLVRTAAYERLELDLVASPAESPGQEEDSVSWFHRLSFPHMAATTVVCFDVILAIGVLSYSEGVASFLFHSIYLLYPAAFFGALQLRSRLQEHSKGLVVISGVRGLGLFFATVSLLLAALSLLFLLLFIVAIWVFFAILAVVFLPGIGLAAVQAEIEGLWALFSPEKTSEAGGSSE